MDRKKPNMDISVSETVRRIFKAYEADNLPEYRRHLGGSVIGHHCERYCWYSFRWCLAVPFSGRILRLFDTGNREESRLVTDLRRIGVNVWDIDPRTGSQINQELFNGHFAVNIDGIGQNFPESKANHVLEFKTHNDKSFKELIKHNKIEKSHPRHYAQIQIGMHLNVIDRGAYLAKNKNNDDLYLERIYPDKELANRLIDKAERIIFSNIPLRKCSDSPAWWQCKLCPLTSICHGEDVPEVNCRTCAHSTPGQDGSWSCSVFGQCKEEYSNLIRCPDHIYIPALLENKLGNPINYTGSVVEYERGTNHRGGIITEN